MKCKSCKNQIPDGSIYCLYCGERQVRERKKAKGEDIKVPAPKQLPSGAWNIYLRAEGQSITEATPELCITRAKAIRAGFVEQKKASPRLTLEDAIARYIADNQNTLSPSTLRGYEQIGRLRFQAYKGMDVSAVPWQKAISEEAANCSPKTVKNAWALVAAVAKANEIELPNVHLPAVQHKDGEWLTYNQILQFLSAVRGEPCELASLLALHSLRRSEIMALTPDKIKNGEIFVQGADVIGIGTQRIHKETNKNDTSTRRIPIMIPRLQELLDAAESAQDAHLVSTHINTLYGQINRVCRRAGLPEVGVHGLRRSFASLAYTKCGWPERVTMKIGGWSDWKTMHEIYIKLDEADVKDAAEKMKELYRQ